MTRHAAIRWRQIRLGAAFAQFGLTALAVAFVVAPILRLRVGPGKEPELRIQRAIHRAFAGSVRLWKWLGLIRVDSKGLESLAACRPCVVVANHPTLIDVVLMGGVLEQMDCIVNAGWIAKSPFLARAIDVAGYARNDGGQAVVDECASHLRKGRTVMVFAEGTRSPWNGLGKFHRGAAHIALASGAPIVAVSIQCRPRFLGSGRKWHVVPDAASCYTLKVAGRIDPKDYSSAGVSTAIAARRLTHDLRQIYLEEPNLADA